MMYCMQIMQKKPNKAIIEKYGTSHGVKTNNIV